MKQVFFALNIAALLLVTSIGQVLASPIITANDREIESKKANALYDKIFDERLARSPNFQTVLGMKTNYDQWVDLSEAFQAESLALTKKQLTQLQGLDPKKLDPQSLLSYQLLEAQLSDEIADYQWRHHNYPINQMRGIHSSTPALLINSHTISNEQEARDYIARLRNTKTYFQQAIEQLAIRANKGIIPPKFVFPHVIKVSKNIIAGAPFEQGKDSTLLADFKSKINQLDLDKETKSALLQEAKKALLNEFKSAYQLLIDYLIKLEKKADTNDGVWKFPDGKRFYDDALQDTTTTQLNAEQIHQLGLQEVTRIHQEMKAIMKKVGFKGNLQAFFNFMRNDPQFYYNNDEQGRNRYLKEATDIIETVKLRLDELFNVKPKADLVVKRVEAFREQSAGKAFYQMPSADGQRPGTYYANLYDMESMPIYQMEALAYHEGIPGHHMQIAIKQELENMPNFRKYSRYTAYVEGWGLYAELLPKEIGFYQDPYSDFGRLAMELWRACRLVVDTGIHAKRWTREQALAYYTKNTPNAEADAIKMVERHVVLPSQATAYKVGMLKIVELRAKAKEALKEQFDIRDFHDVVLANGPVPLHVLEKLIDEYITLKRQ